MIAVDTNVIVRLVTADDPGQLRTARSLFQADLLWVCKTVLLETEWVLRYSYGLDRDAIQTVFHRLLGYPHLQVEDRVAVLRALRLHGLGMDFADALHLTSSGDAERFATFDQQLAKIAGEVDDGPMVDLLVPAGL